MGTTGTIAAILVTAVLTWIGHAVLTHQQRRLEIAKALEAKKRELYQTVMGTFFDMMKNSKTGKVEPEKMVPVMFDIARDMSVYASDEVLRKYLEMKSFQDGPAVAEPLGILMWFGELIIAMRKDLGHSTTLVKPADVLRLVVTDFDQQVAKIGKDT